MTSSRQASTLACNGRLTIRKVASADAADDGALKITLFRAGKDGACGWYIGPLSTEDGRITLPYLPRSAETIASVAVVRGVRAAEKTESPVCLIDPDDLWALAWRA